MKKLLILFGLLLASPSFAADNSVIVTPGVGVTMRSKDVGSGVESMIHILGDTTGNPIYGTAGAANANILTVQGIASMTPFLATATLNAETTKVIGTVRNVGNVGGVFDAIGQNVAAPANWTQSGCQFNTTPTTITTGNGSPCQVDNAGNLLVNVKADATAASLLSAVQAATPAGTNRVGYTTDDPCNNASAKVYTPINVVTATNVIITGVSAKNKYVCSIFLYPAAADNVAIYQATTGTSCATAQVAIFGGTTTATGFVMTAQAGFVVGTGSAAVAKTTVVNTDICVTTSAAVQLSGVVVTADQ